MKSNIRRAASVLVLALGALGLTACEPQQPAQTATSAAPREAVNRDVAIQSAQRDAAYRYSEMRISRVEARKLGGFWVVELTSWNGPGLRYTISALDGSIRERNMFQ